jgi:hypothetical protein
MTPGRMAQAAALVSFAGIALAGCSVAGISAPALRTSPLAVPSYTPSATVGKIKITQSEVVTRARVLALLDPDITASQAVTKSTTTASLTQLVDESELLQGNPVHATAADVQSMEQQLNELLVQYYGSSSAVSKREKALNVTASDWKSFARDYASVSLAAQKYEPTVTSAQVKAYYEANASQFKLTAAEVNARHILVKTQKLAKSILAMLKAGGNFADLAKKYSIDTGSASEGGNLGWFTASEMVAPFSKAAFATPVGHYVIAHSQYGWHVIQVLGKEAAGTVPPLSQIESQVQQDAQETQNNANVNQAVAQFKKRFPVSMHSPSAK